MSGFRFQRFMFSDFLSEYTCTYAFQISLFSSQSTQLERCIREVYKAILSFLPQTSNSPGITTIITNSLSFHYLSLFRR